MIRFLILAVTQFGKTKGFSKFINKYGQKAFDKIQNKLGPNTKFSVKTTKKTGAKSKPVKKVTELQRVKAQIKRDKLNPRLKVKEPKGKVVGKVRRNYGKWEPTYSTGKKYKPYVPPKKP